MNEKPTSVHRVQIDENISIEFKLNDELTIEELIGFNDQINSLVRTLRKDTMINVKRPNNKYPPMAERFEKVKLAYKNPANKKVSLARMYKNLFGMNSMSGEERKKLKDAGICPYPKHFK